MRENVIVALLLLLVVGLPQGLNAAGVGKVVARGVTRRLAGKAVGRTAANRATAAIASRSAKPSPGVLKFDRWRDSKAPVKRLTQPRSVYRYTTKGQAQLYRRSGVPSGVHFTVKAGPGRPLSAGHAKSRYGLPRIPTTRVEAVLPRGTPVKTGKVLGGEPGYGELKTYRRPLSPLTVKSVVPIRK